MGRFRTPVLAAGAMAAVLAVVMLAGCTPRPSEGQPKSSATSVAQPSATPQPTPAPSYVPDGTAEANKAYFDSVNSALIKANPSVGGRTIIDTLVAAGFDKANMQLTPDKTTIGRDVDSVLFSVRTGESCLLGQRSGSEYTSSVQAALKNGTCLVGETRPINW